MRSIFTTAVVQFAASSVKEENYERVERFLKEAQRQGAELAVLPERWNWCGEADKTRQAAETLEGPSLKFLQRLACGEDLLILAGSIAETHPKNKPPFNTSVCIKPDGSLGKPYRKIHLFDAGVGEGYQESAHTTAGDEVVVEDWKGFKIGLSICYDLRFPELYRLQASRGADILAIPSNFTAWTGPPHWEILVRARAIENQCFVLAANQTGVPGSGGPSHGHSMIVDPWGEILARMEKEEGVAVVRLDLTRLDEIRRKMPVARHRKL